MLVDFRLCNVLLSDGARSAAYPELYVRKSNPVRKNADGTHALSDPSFAKYDFTTYFNAFPNRKWRTYTVIDNVCLRLRIRGDFDLTLVAYEQAQGRPRRGHLGTRHFECAGYEDVELAYPDTDALLLSFELTCYGKVDVAEAYYYTKVEEARIRPVELAVATTTFQKEDYVLPNIELFRDAVLGADEPIAGHFTVHVVDNGRTLDPDAHGSERIHIHPNPNVGGAGGFTRGMIEAMEQTPAATHVLLMDDDVQVSPESLKRTYNVLSLVNDDYAEAFVSGAMLSFERQDEFYEDIGYVDANGIYGPTKEPADDRHFVVSDLDDLVQLESFEVHRHNCYAGWWYCCVPVSVIRDKGLPLPLFIRGDDAEYGNRCAKRFIAMSGICIWHLTLAFKFRASFERYQVPRNSLIAQATTGVYPDVDFIRSIDIFSSLDFKNFNYDGIDLAIRALEDYLKGPEFLKRVNAADLNSQMAMLNETLVPLAEIDDPRVREVEFNAAQLFEEGRRGLVSRLYDFMTMNGQRGPRALSKGGLGVIPFHGWLYSPNLIRGKDALLAVSYDGSEGVLRRKDRRRFAELQRRYKAVMREYGARKDEVRAEWAAARGELTSAEFWKWYLQDQAK